MRVGVAGALGRLGRVASAAIHAADDLVLVAAFDRTGAGDRLANHIGVGGEALLHDTLESFYAVGMDVVVDCTVYPVTIDVARGAIDNKVSPVIAATGWTDEDIVVLEDDCDEQDVPGMLVPNFSVGAVLMMKLAAEAARVMPHVEKNVPIHSVRLPGYVAHQEVLFGGDGETLTIRHDSISRDSFGPGIVLAVRNVTKSTGGLTIGLESLLFPAEAVS